MVFRLLREAQPASAFQRRFSQNLPPSLLAWVSYRATSHKASAFLSKKTICHSRDDVCLAVFFVTVSETRPTNPDYAQGYTVMFTDAFPILMASQVLFRSFSGFPTNDLSANVVIC
jgi:hypothetical protein